MKYNVFLITTTNNFNLNIKKKDLKKGLTPGMTLRQTRKVMVEAIKELA